MFNYIVCGFLSAYCYSKNWMFAVTQTKQKIKLKLKSQLQLRTYSLILILDVVKEYSERKQEPLTLWCQGSWKTKKQKAFPRDQNNALKIQKQTTNKTLLPSLQEVFVTSIQCGFRMTQLGGSQLSSHPFPPEWGCSLWLLCLPLTIVFGYVGERVANNFCFCLWISRTRGSHVDVQQRYDNDIKPRVWELGTGCSDGRNLWRWVVFSPCVRERTKVFLVTTRADCCRKH